MLCNKQLTKRTAVQVTRPVIGKMKRQACGKQQGFVLVLALVMLAVLTLIGVSSMDSASIELKATSNARHHQIAFNAVQSLLDYSVSKNSPVDYQPANLSTPQTINYDDGNAATKDLVATVSYTGCNTGVGSDQEGGGFSYNFFDIQGSGTNASGTAISLQSQGIRFPSASCDPTLTPTLTSTP